MLLRTGLLDTAWEAAVAFARLRAALVPGSPLARGRKVEKSAEGRGASKKLEVGVFLGVLLRQQRLGVPTV